MGDRWEPDSAQDSALGVQTGAVSTVAALTLRTGRTPPVFPARRSLQSPCLAGTRWGGWGGYHTLGKTGGS